MLVEAYSLAPLMIISVFPSLFFYSLVPPLVRRLLKSLVPPLVRRLVKSLVSSWVGRLMEPL